MKSRLIRRPPTRRLVDLLAYLWIRAKRLVRRMAHQKATPQQIAFGGALGVLIGFTPTFGLQMVIAVALATLLRCSRFAALVTSYVTSPFTVVPIYTFTYKIGSWLTGQEPIHRHIRLVLTQLQDEGWVAALHGFFRFGWRLAVPLWVGGLAIGIPAAVITYSMMLRLVEGHRLVTAEKRKRRELRRLERMRMAAGLATTGDAVPKDVKMPEPSAHEQRDPRGKKDQVIELDAKEPM